MNGKIVDAEIELELSGDRRAIDRLLLTSQKELKQGFSDLKDAVDDMRQVCEQRALVCPGMDIVDPPEQVPPQRTDDRRLWVMWNVFIGIVKEVGLPVLVAVLATLALTGRI